MELKRRRLMLALVAALACAVAWPSGALAGARQADARLDKAMKAIVTMEHGPPGMSVVVQRGKDLRVHSAGAAKLGGSAPIRGNQHMRFASVTKAVTGALALELVEDGKLSLDSTIGEVRPDLPAAWGPITLRQLLHHTSGLPSYTADPAFLAYFAANLKAYISPLEAISYVFNEPLEFTPGTHFEYSNTDNIVIGLMAERAAGRGIVPLLKREVFGPLGMTNSTMPKGFDLPGRSCTGYVYDAQGQLFEEVSEAVSVSSVWAAGAVISTPLDMNRFIRAFGGGSMFSSAKVRRAQTAFLPPFTGGEPIGPGQNRGGLTLYRYRTPCGVVFGHSGNFPGYTQWIASTPDGRGSTVVSANLQLDIATGPPGVFPPLRRIFRRAACAALAG